MSYAVILSKPQDLLVKELFNYYNTESYDIGHLSLVDAPAAQEGPYNTYQRIAIAPHPEGVDVGTAVIHFNRIDLSTLFSVVEVKLREVDVKADGSYDELLVLQEVQRKYGINTATGQFGLTQVEGQDVFYAKSTNPAFIGYSPLVVELSLDSRIGYRELNGFEIATDVIFNDVFITYASQLPTAFENNPFQIVELNGYMYAVFNRTCFRLNVDTGEWVRRANCIGQGNRRASLVVHGKIYVAGGYTTGYQHSTFEVYDPDTDTWTQLASLPKRLFGATMLHHAGKIYLYGGFSAQNGIERLTSMFMYDIINNAWTYLGNYGRSGQSACGVEYEGKFYYHGGLRSNASPYIETAYTFMFDPNTNTETELMVGPQVRHGAASGIYGGKMYVFGGVPDEYVNTAIYDIS